MVHSVPHRLIKCMHFSYTAPGFTALIGGRPSVYVIATYVHTCSYTAYTVYVTHCTSKEVVQDSSSIPPDLLCYVYFPSSTLKTSYPLVCMHMNLYAVTYLE